MNLVIVIIALFASVSCASDFILNSVPTVNVTVTNAYTVTNITTLATNYVFITNSTTTYVTNSSIPVTGQTTGFYPADDGDLQRGVTNVQPRFTIDPGGTGSLTNWVYDNMTGLVWSRSGMQAASNWTNALSYCESYSDAGYNDWRLPNALELMSIVNFEHKKPCFTDVAGTSQQTINGQPFYNYSTLRDAKIWSSTTVKGMTGFATTLDVLDGHMNFSDKSGATILAWPIRN